MLSSRLLSDVSRGQERAQTTSFPQPSFTSEVCKHHHHHHQHPSLSQMSLLRLPPSLRHLSLSTLRTLTTTAQNAPPPPPPPSTLTLTPSTLNTYAITNPPTPRNLRVAATFFQRTAPEILFTTPHFRSLPPSPFPEVTFLGRSNVGKSSLLNALFGRPNQKIAYVSKRPGKTVTMNAYGVGGKGMVGAAAGGKGKEARWKRWDAKKSLLVVDMPGYGNGSREEWGREVSKYLMGRKQLRKSYVLVDAEHGLKQTDRFLLRKLRWEGVPFQIVLSKVDKILFPRAKMPSAESLGRRLGVLREVKEGIRRELEEELEGGVWVGDFLNKGRRIGVDELRWSVLEACGLQDQEGVRKGMNEDFKVQEDGDGEGDAVAFDPLHGDEDAEETGQLGNEEPLTLFEAETIWRKSSTEGSRRRQYDKKCSMERAIRFIQKELLHCAIWVFSNSVISNAGFSQVHSDVLRKIQESRS
ncbi:uncharacterized protein MYCFIDRAFT_207486 [Pseudocercospora fijiensis CIRAD86]|uniref:EngB-type G domain-containing protein n=1 Tax=Pseudocercospora fijiensis (strain CIRAD86) TaxID=383855 RepID=M2Z5K7_PSEFD|nr:uncharacterized protein MYCFIDRAFT_207486 [Pseudocercospora fijiensis CIRAD86]EME85100.1 hypothetical protein MYCFIDRAFT_207486 [Pseudocercospora fijiensis CIRAD86]